MLFFFKEEEGKGDGSWELGCEGLISVGGKGGGGGGGGGVGVKLRAGCSVGAKEIGGERGVHLGIELPVLTDVMFVYDTICAMECSGCVKIQDRGKL